MPSRYQREVEQIRQRLHQAVERYELQSEELTVWNEELQAMNEELRASGSELEDSRHELQRLNDELRTVNDELLTGIREKVEATEVIQNLINSTAIGTIFLDRQLCIKFFTPSARDVFQLIPSDVGRPLSQIRSALIHPGLFDDLQHVINRPERVEREVETRDGRWQLMRALPYRTAAGIIDGIVLTFFDITERTRAEALRRDSEKALQEAHDDLEQQVEERTRALASAVATINEEVNVRRRAEDSIRNLLRRIITVEEDERRRIARDLHDHLGQQTTALKLKLEAVRNAGSAKQSEAALEATHEVLAKLDRDLDFFTRELRPPALDDLGVVAALEHFVGEWSRNFGIPADFHTRGLEELRLSRDAEIALYRIAQEALNNIYKHARATSVAVMVERRGQEARLVIEDNGCGFDRSLNGTKVAHRLGLIGMNERAALMGGSLEIESAADKGTTVFVRVPVPASASEQT